MRTSESFVLNRRLVSLWLPVLLLADAVALCVGFGTGELRTLGMENGPLENVQSLLLFLCIGIYLWCVRVGPRTALAAATLALLCLSLLLRELDIDDPRFGFSYVTIFFVQGFGRYFILAPLWTVAALFMARDFRRHRDTILSYALSTSGRIMIAAGFVTALGWIFDHLTAKGGLSMFVEEFIELNGYALLLLAALHAPASLRQIATRPPADH